MKAILVICLVGLLEMSKGAKKMIHPSVKICKRNDPQLSDCFKENFMRMLGTIKNGIPEMNIVSIDPVKIENVILDFPESSSINLRADLYNMSLKGINDLKLNKIEVNVLPDRLAMNFEMLFPKIFMNSDYKALGKFLLLSIDSIGDFHGEFDNIYVKAKWWSQPYTKKSKIFLKWDSEVEEMTIGKMQMHFNRLFGNNTDVTDNVNKVINENIDSIYDEVKPVILETIVSLANNVINNVYALFPYNVLFPEE